MIVTALLFAIAFAMTSDMQQLVSNLTSSDATTRADAAESLCRLGEKAQRAAASLVRAAGDPSRDVVEWSTAALEELGPPSEEQLAELAALVGDERPDVSYWAATLLGRAGPNAAPAVDALSAAVSNHPVPETRERAAWSLGKIGPAAKGALPALREASQSANRRLAGLAGKAIEMIEEDR